MEKLKKQWFPSEEDNIWRMWVDFKERKPDDLLELLSMEVKDCFKKRALFILVAPIYDFNPIYWKNNTDRFHKKTDFLAKLPPDLLSYTADLIIQFSAVLKPERHHHSTTYTRQDEYYNDALCFYNNCILELLILLPVEQGKKFFPFFSLNDISVFHDMEDMSGYNPFKNLLYNEEIDEYWKKTSDQIMRKIILDELGKKRNPREDWENALGCYANIIQKHLYGSRSKYPIELFAGQMQFIIDHYQKDIDLILWWNVKKIFNIFSDKCYKKLRHRISRFMVENGDHPFYNGETKQAVDQILKEFNDDFELVTKINILIEQEKNGNQS